MPKASVWRRYRAYGLEIDSSLEIPDFLEIPYCDIKADVEIQQEYKPVEQHEQVNWFIREESGIFYMYFKGIGQFVVAKGENIHFRSDSAASEAERVHLYLSGIVMGMLLYQRGYLVMHASAVMSPKGDVFLFAGDSGAGKSSTAAFLSRYGYQVLDDDIIPLKNKDGAIRVEQGRTRVKLNHDVFESVQNAAHETGFYPYENKYFVSAVPASGSIAAGNVKAIYLMERGDAFQITDLPKSQATMGLIRNSVPWRLLKRRGDVRQMEQCVDIAQTVPIFRFVRQGHIVSAASSIDMLMKHFDEIY